MFYGLASYLSSHIFRDVEFPRRLSNRSRNKLEELRYRQIKAVFDVRYVFALPSLAQQWQITLVSTADQEASSLEALMGRV
jgi:hypothetical protein